MVSWSRGVVTQRLDFAGEGQQQRVHLAEAKLSDRSLSHFNEM